MRTFVTWLDRQGYAQATRRNYLRRVAEFEDWLAEQGRPPARQATWKDIRRWAETLHHTYPTRSLAQNALTAFYRHLGRRDGGPAWAVPKPKRIRGRYRGLDTDEDKDRLLAAAKAMGSTEYAIVCGLYYQALRREECSRLRWTDFRDGRLTGVGKCDIPFDRPLHERFAEALRALEPSSPWVFPGRWPGTHISPNTVWMVCRLAGERAGLGRVTPHQLRHTSIGVVNDTIGLRAAADHARHTDIQTTMIYTRTVRETELAGMAAL